MSDPVGNAAWMAKIDTVLSNPTLDDEARRQGVRDVLVELTQRPLYVVYRHGNHSIYDFSKFGDHTHPVYTFSRDMEDTKSQRLLSSVSISYQDYIWSIHYKTYDRGRSDQSHLVIKHFEEHDLSLFKRLDELKFWFPIKIGSNPSKSWGEYIKSQQPKPTVPPVPTVPRNNSIGVQGRDPHMQIIVALNIGLIIVVVGSLTGVASVFGTVATLIIMLCVVVALIVLNEMKKRT